MKRVVLAYDGGGETSVAIPWLMDEGGVREVVAMVVDVGRGAALVEVRERALALGAVRCHVIDAREELARDYVLPALHAGMFVGGGSPRISSLARRLVARKLVDVARMEHADAVAVAAGVPTDAETLEALVRELDPARDVIVPAREWAMTGEALAAYARAHDVEEVAGAADAIVDANIWGRTTIVAIDDAASISRATPAYELTRSPEHAPDQPADLEIEFAAGVPVRVNGIDMSLLEMFESLETIGGSHGIGRSDLTITGRDGRRYREFSESPAAVILDVANAALHPAGGTGRTRVRLFKGTCTAHDGGASADTAQGAATAQR